MKSPQKDDLKKDELQDSQPNGKKRYIVSGEQIYQMIIESAADFAILTVDLDGKFTTWNVGAERIFGFGEKETVDQDISLIFTSEDNERGIPQREIQDSLTKGKAQDNRWHVRKDLSRFWADGVMMPLVDSLGVTHGFLKIIRDRTEYRLIQERLDAQTKELHALHAEIAELKKRIT